MTRSWDIFCSVVDNYGDIGVCWRLARQLSSVVGYTVRLWLDDLPRFRCLCHAVDPAQDSQKIAGVEVRRWDKAFPAVAPADIVIEGFGVRLPDVYVAAMAARAPQPVWINFEYLSAENWVDGCHGLPSPHPVLPLVKYFYFPGYTPATGGLLVEAGLARTRDEFQRDPAARTRFWPSLGVAMPHDFVGTVVSLFCYDNAALPALLGAWEAGAEPVVCVVPEDAAARILARITGMPTTAGSASRRGSLTVHVIPFLELDSYDRLLWACDLNFVRGEDSFVRAQLAARPLVWQAYPQEGEAHLRKVSAFFERYTASLAPPVGQTYAALAMAWNRQSAQVADRWVEFNSLRQDFEAHARAWASLLVEQNNLAAKLAVFCESRIK